MPNYSLKPWIDTIAEGLVREWNKARGTATQSWQKCCVDGPIREAHRDAAIREHDRILSVNGVPGS